MKSSVFKSGLAICLFFSIIFSVMAQSGRPTQNVPVKEAPKKASTGEAEHKEIPASQEEPPDPDAIKLDTTLITVPVIASDRNGLYIPDLKAEDFTIYEDGTQQEVAHFATVKEPFHVVLIIDTSGSSRQALYQIQHAAITFVEQLQTADRMQVISFDNEVRVLTKFTSNREQLKQAIESTRLGADSHVYDAFNQAITSLLPVRRDRRAIIFFTDGVDHTSISSRYEDNIRAVQESGIIVYPIRYETRAETEALIREQQRRGQVPDIGVILKRPPTTTPPTTPGGGGSPIPDSGSRLPGGIPVPKIPSRSPYPDDRRNPNDPRNPNDRRYPNDPNDPRSRNPNDPLDPRNPYPSDSSRGERSGDMTSAMLDNLYRIADQYMNDLALKSGGKLHRADSIRSLPDVFAKIAAELRTQYALGYYSTNAKHDGSYRKIQVKTARKNTVIRARPGYQAQNSGD
jgi:Mg-chelatase subunit ChlD